MKIAHVSPLFESVPPKLYGGTERVVSYLVEELVRQGHEVTLFASGDSLTSARLVPMCRKSLRLSDCVDDMPHHVYMIEKVAQLAAGFDVVHFHTGILHFPLARRLSAPHVTTMHGRLDLANLKSLATEFSDLPLVSISDSQRLPWLFMNWAGTVYHGLPLDLLPFSERHQGYLAFLGRISPEKRVDRAVAMAVAAGVPLKIAAKIDKKDAEYFETHIKHLFDHPLVEYVGEIGEAEKGAFLGGAMALLFPIDWPEPFGLTMIESLACGTPVIAYDHGSVPEVLRQGHTAFIVDSVEAGAKAIGQVESLPRRQCRQEFERRFSVRTMAKRYVKIYETLISDWEPRSRQLPNGSRSTWQKSSRLANSTMS
ncbi:glycosyltransferase family 4 protein [Desulfocurvibacter africanus]|uniref:glycosyltransferase family 4 protein n=1 Tax=Desulfocurvibacter africanus TaxID=873 RepID=UPI002FDA6E61